MVVEDGVVPALRLLAGLSRHAGHMVRVDGALLDEAADEIENLRRVFDPSLDGCAMATPNVYVCDRVKHLVTMASDDGTVLVHKDVLLDVIEDVESIRAHFERAESWHRGSMERLLDAIPRPLYRWIWRRYDRAQVRAMGEFWPELMPRG